MSGTRIDNGPSVFLTDEECEANLSALIDGELDGTLLLPTIDHLVRSERCRRFYRDARLLRELLSGERAKRLVQEKPADTWKKIEWRSGLHRPQVFRLFSKRSPFWAAAAAVLLVLGLWTGGYRKLVQPFQPEGTIHIRLAEDRGSMDEKRFVELTAELLRADRRYQRKMLEIMETVNSGEFVMESAIGDETDTALASSVGYTRRNNGAPGDLQNADRYW